MNDKKDELSKEDIDFLLKLSEEDLDKLAYTTDVQITFEMKDDSFRIKEIKR